MAISVSGCFGQCLSCCQGCDGKRKALAYHISNLQDAKQYQKLLSTGTVGLVWDSISACTEPGLTWTKWLCATQPHHAISTAQNRLNSMCRVLFGSATKYQALCPAPRLFFEQVGVDATPPVSTARINALVRVGWWGKEERLYGQEHLRKAFNPLSAQGQIGFLGFVSATRNSIVQCQVNTQYTLWKAFSTC